MKCSQLDTLDLAKAYAKAVNDTGGEEVTIDDLAPHLKETGSSCGPCPAMLPLARKAFAKHRDELGFSADATKDDAAQTAYDQSDIPHVPKV